MTLDNKLTYVPHIQQAVNKTHSILLYGAKIWADAMIKKKYRNKMMSVQRQDALRIACSYRTVSGAAVMVIAGIIPIDVLAFERKRIYNRSADIGRAEAAIEERNNTVTEWQNRWSSETKGQ